MNITIEYAFLFATSLFGILIHLITKAEAIKKRNDAAGLSGSPFRKLFKEDYISIIKAILLNGALLIFYAYAQNKWTEIDFWMGMVMFLFSGYTGSSFVLSLFSKVDKLQREDLNNVSILTPNKMEEYIWELQFEKSTDKVDFESTEYSIEEFAQMTGGEFSTDKIIYTEEPRFSEVTWVRLDTTTYLSAPIRKPK